jgi:Zn-dependent protease
MSDLSTTDLLARIRKEVADVLAVESVTIEREKPLTVCLRGRLLVAPQDAYPLVQPRLEALGMTTLFRREEGAEVIRVVRASAPEASSRLWVAGVLLLLTLVSVLFVGMGMGVDDPNATFLELVLGGLPYAVGLVSILLAHELGHYFVGRRLGMPLSLPYFIPLPLNLFGTMGAFIRMKGPAVNRRRLLSMAAAGPLAGLVVAIPVLVVGLLLSDIRTAPAGSYISEGNSLLYIALKALVFGRFLPSGGEDVWLHPLAFAGWGGLFITGLNLIPAGQLDGGHIIYTVMGKRSRLLTHIVLAGLVGLDVLNYVLHRQINGLSLFAALIFFLGREHAALLDDLTELEPRQRAFGWLMMLVWALVFVPIPVVFVR